jgi:two-component system sensor histidine kinase BaeS
MKIRIQHKLFLAMLAAAGAVVLCMYLVMRWSFDRNFLKYLHTVDLERLEAVAGKLEEAYAGEGSWRFLSEDPQRLRALLWGSPGMMPHGPGGRRGMGMGMGMGPMRDMPPGPSPEPGWRFLRRIVLLDGEKNPVFGPPRPPGGIELRPLIHDGKTVGYLGSSPEDRVRRAAAPIRPGAEEGFAFIAVAVVVCSPRSSPCRWPGRWSAGSGNCLSHPSSGFGEVRHARSRGLLRRVGAALPRFQHAGV